MNLEREEKFCCSYCPVILMINQHEIYLLTFLYYWMEISHFKRKWLQQAKEIFFRSFLLNHLIIQGLQVKYRLEMTNGENAWGKQFSADERCKYLDVTFQGMTRHQKFNICVDNA